MLPSRDTEFDNFKTQIDLRAYAVSVGFELIRRQSSRHSSVLKHSNGDKIVVARMPWRHYVYFNVHGSAGNDSGSIIDFVQNRERCSLGHVRKILRGWNGSSATVSSKWVRDLPSLLPSSADSARVLANWLKAKAIDADRNYLSNERRISPEIIGHPIFIDRLRTDARGNVLMAHHNKDGLCGYEVKNRGFTGFAPGGTKGLMFSRPRDTDHAMVISETAVDLLSVATLDGTEGKRFFSLAGQPSPVQIELLRSAASKMPRTPTIMLALDNDQGGRTMAGVLASALSNVASSVDRYLPAIEGQDWNDVLTEHRKSGSPHPRFG
ncbi:DUF3991 and TOPRIM domain-containing protein [Crateriforma conspicua]|uniref:DUF3991 and TOPRIM domain-containing protein n=1 Tax=Crateriforma conspicua TaxID=2527996 RepID=UPI0011882378|nr:DUF3991 and TOPRIM domain-containing protein [Crateriforma conspicua]QDV61980.1 hypothetical protein Mal65_11080 [Crateriforma conspicua]